MTRSTKQIIDSQDELAQAFLDYQPNPADRRTPKDLPMPTVFVQLHDPYTDGDMYVALHTIEVIVPMKRANDVVVTVLGLTGHTDQVLVSETPRQVMDQMVLVAQRIQRDG